jgi:preprotein translocase SecF subunit
MRLFHNVNYNFMGIRKISFSISILLILISILSLILHGGPKYSVDFHGGTFMEIRFEDKLDPGKPLSINIGQVRDVFSEFNLGNAEIKHYGSLQEISARADFTENTDEIFHNLADRLSREFPEYNVIEMRKETVGPRVGKELVGNAIMAVLISTILMLIYIRLRFKEIRFGVGAVVALLHNVILTIGIFSVLNYEMSIAIVAAILTVVGYSINDTIVVFDRIRENLKILKRQTFNYSDLINRSINETLSRTVITGGTTILSLTILFFFGGEVLKDFSFAMLFGIIVGTYSSIFIASPILIEFERRKKIE